MRHLKLAILTLAALGMFGAAYFAPQRGSDQTLVSRSAQQKKEALLRYELRVSGRAGSCTVTKHGTAEATRAELDLNEDCIALMPRLAEARYWQQGAAGEVMFVSDDGRLIMEFFASDGVAYESLRPISPLVALTAR